MLSIIIPNYFLDKTGKIVQDEDEGVWFARHCFDRIKRFTELPFELILIDNGCVVGNELLKDNADVLVVNEENQGFAKASNQGFKKAKYKWLCLMNNDIFVWKGWEKALMKTFEDNDDCGVAMPALMKQTKRGDEALEIENIDLSKNYGEYSRGAEFGSCWLTKREILDEVGLFDENFKCGFGEDRDMWRRMRLLGYQTYRTHKTRVFHQGNVTMGKIENRRQYTLPNREYLAEIVRQESELKRELTKEEKKALKMRVEKNYK